VADLLHVMFHASTLANKICSRKSRQWTMIHC